MKLAVASHRGLAGAEAGPPGALTAPCDPEPAEHRAPAVT